MLQNGGGISLVSNFWACRVHIIARALSRLYPGTDCGSLFLSMIDVELTEQSQTELTIQQFPSPNIQDITELSSSSGQIQVPGVAMVQVSEFHKMWCGWLGGGRGYIRSAINKSQ